MFKMFDRYLKHRAAMDIMHMAVSLTSDAIFRGEKEDIEAFITRVDKTAASLADAHVKVCTKLLANNGAEPSAGEVKALGTIFNRKDST